MGLIPVTKTCNQRCLFCSAHGREDNVPLSRVLELIDAAAAAGAGSVTLSGGETTFSPDLPGIIARARAHGLAVELQTNALTSAYPENASRLASLGVSLFNVNFPSHEAAVNDRLTGTRGTLPLRIKGVKNLLLAGGRVRLTHLITSLNYKKLPAFARFALLAFSGLDYIQFSFIKILGLAAENTWLAPGYAEAAPWLIKAFGVCRRGRIKAVADHIPPCFLGPFADRSVDYIKLSGGAGDLSAARTEKRKLPECGRCLLGDRCLGPRIDHAGLLSGRALARPITKIPGRAGKLKAAERKADKKGRAFPASKNGNKKNQGPVPGA